MKVKNILSSIAVAATLIGGGMSLSTAHVYADNAALPAPVIGVVDIQKILADLPVTKEIQKQLENLRKSFATEVGKYEAELRKADTSLAEAQKKLSEAEFAKKRTAFENRIGEVQKIVEGRKAQLDKAFAGAMEKVNAKVMEAISQVAKAKGLNLVLFPMSVAYSAENLDVSKEVSEIVKKTLTNVKIEMSDK
ncbi:MAG: OmpH family outer membrane protein [Proteobacteria bacterium]|nr:OmpH family outer membrane protein [Pseudomonadota bacterium]